MKAIKIIAVLVISILFGISSTHAQQSILKNIDRLLSGQSSYVYGQVVDIDYRKDDQTGLIETVAIIKGLNGEEYKLITLGGMMNDEIQFTSHGFTPKEGQTGFWELIRQQRLSSSDEYTIINLIPESAFPIITEYEDTITSQIAYKASIREGYNLFAETNSLNSCGSLDETGVLSVEFTNPRYNISDNTFRMDLSASSTVENVILHNLVIGVEYSETIGTLLDSIGAVQSENPEGKGYDESYTYITSDFNDTTLILSLEFQDYDSPITLSEASSEIATLVFDVTKLSGAGSFKMPDIVSTNASYECDGDIYTFNDVNLGSPLDAAQCQEGQCVPLKYRIRNLVKNEASQTVNFVLTMEGGGPSRFSDGIVRLKYNTDVFGPSFESIAVSARRPEFPGSVYDLLLIDVAPGEVDIYFFTESTYINDLTILEEEVQYVIFTLPYIDCEQPHGLDFALQTVTNRHIHQTGQIPLELEMYDPVTFEEYPDAPLCDDCDGVPVITGFSPMEVPAGTGDVLTIMGNNFGSFDPQLSKVSFIDGDVANGNARMNTGREDFIWDDITHWTDTKIEVKVPSLDGSSVLTPEKPAASGTIIVRNECGSSQESQSELFIPYALYNLRTTSGGKAFPIIPVTSTSNSAPTPTPEVEFQLHESFDGTAWSIYAIEAINEFAVSGNIDFTVKSGAFVGGTAVSSDGISKISYVEGSGGAAHNVAGIYYFNNPCNSPNGLAYGFKESDIVVNSPDVISPTLAQILTFKEKLKHELGHAAMLNHASGGNPRQLLFPNGNSSGNPTQDDRDGICRSLEFSNTFADIGTCGMPLNECNTSSTKNNPLSQVYFKAYPNPSRSGILNFDLVNPVIGISREDLFFTDMLGRPISFEVLSLTPNGGSIQFHEQQAQGILFITGSNGERYHMKILSFE